VAKGEVTGRTDVAGFGDDDDLIGVSPSPDGEWKVGRGTLIRADGSEKPLEVLPQVEVAIGMYGVTWSADSKRMALGRAIGATSEERRKEENLSMVVFDLTTKSQVAELATGKVLRSAFSADGKRLATLGKTKVTVWEVATGKAVFEAACDGGTTIRRRAIAFTPDGKRLITGHETHALVWDIGGK
jgi:hypothetical protein